MSQWECPCCHSGNLEYWTIDFYDDQCYFPRTCEDCGAEWEEWYAMEFIWHENIIKWNKKEKKKDLKKEN